MSLDMGAVTVKPYIRTSKIEHTANGNLVIKVLNLSTHLIDLKKYIMRHDDLYSRLAMGAFDATPTYYCNQCGHEVEIECDHFTSGVWPRCKVCGNQVTYHYEGIYK